MSLLDKATGNFWIDNGLVMLHRIWQINQLPADVNPMVQQIVRRIYVETGRTADYWDPQTQQIKTYSKRNWKEPVGLFISVVDQVPKQKVNGTEYYTRPPEPKIHIRLAGNERCDFCGDWGKVVSAKLYLFPFVVDPGKFANFYSHTRRGLKMCARCALAGFAAFESWLWRRQSKTYHFFLFHTDLDRLMRSMAVLSHQCGCKKAPQAAISKRLSRVNIPSKICLHCFCAFLNGFTTVNPKTLWILCLPS